MTGVDESVVDVLLPVRDGAAYLAESIRSLQQQTHEAWRLLVLDDGSSDRTREIAASFAQGDRRIELKAFPRRGLVPTLNAGIELCTADIVARQDADDTSLPSRFAFQVAYLRDHPECLALSGGRTMIDGQGGLVDGPWSPPGPAGQDPFSVPAREPYLMHPFLMVRRDALMRLGGYRHYLHCEDADLCWRLSEDGVTVSASEIMGAYRTHRDSVSVHSIVNTRIQALLSQVAAIAAQRRRSGRGDIVPEPELGEMLRAARTLDSMIEVLGDRLRPDEFRFLRTAGAMKLFEIAFYRPVSLERSDLHFARRALAARPELSSSNLRELSILCRRMWAILREKGEIALAAEIGPAVWGRLLIGSRLRAFGLFRDPGAASPPHHPQQPGR